MIRRLFWLSLGTAFGAWSAFRLKRAARAVLPDSLAHQAAGLGRTVRGFAGDVRVAMNHREEELRDALRLDAQAEIDKDLH
ncbi:hypothetical protein NE236_41105 [Actinoallomurus purpureus]|uniref:hypothetical protein n=1 Tax=Actinoallomurus purpureus TaxID=478114 RepID=UPI002092F546|nr:hypothetical protein [Actinoallomurus purpureus]MCO6011367.1 hypothetical protein [Actinoallomurus purpureus]